MVTEEMIKNYNLTIEEITSIIEENDKILKGIWDTDDGNSREEMRPFNDLDRECLMTINEFKSNCMCGAFMDTDGVGYYATDKEVSNIEASPSAFVKGIIREDFTHVCWYNK